MRITESRLRRLIRQVIKENDSKQSDSDDILRFYNLAIELGMNYEGEKGIKYTKCSRAQVNYQLATRKEEFELQFYVEALGGASNKEALKRKEEDKSKIENLIKTVAKNCGFKPNAFGWSHIIEFNAKNIEDAKKLKECLDKIKEIIVETSLLPELSTPADVTSAFEYVISRYLNESIRMILDKQIMKIIEKKKKDQKLTFEKLIRNLPVPKKILGRLKKAYRSVCNIKLDDEDFGEAIKVGLKKYMQSEINKKTK